MYGSFFATQHFRSFFMADISFNIACKGVKIAATASMS